MRLTFQSSIKQSNFSFSKQNKSFIRICYLLPLCITDKLGSEVWGGQISFFLSVYRAVLKNWKNPVPFCSLFSPSTVTPGCFRVKISGCLLTPQLSEHLQYYVIVSYYYFLFDVNYNSSLFFFKTNVHCVSLNWTFRDGKGIWFCC